MELIDLLGLLAGLVAITVVPVMLAAKWAGARRAGFLAALVAVVLATVAGQLAVQFAGDPLAGTLLAFAAACAVYALVLRTPFVAAVGIAVVALVLQLLIVAGLLALGLQLPGPVPTAI